MSLYQLIMILLAHRKIMIIVFVLTVLVAGVVTMLLPRTYQASTTLIINYKGTDPVTGSTLPAQLASGYMATQVDIISSQNVALKVVDELKLDKTRWAIESFKEVARDGDDIVMEDADIKDWLSRILQNNLVIQPSKNSNAIHLGYKGADPKFVATVANAFADAYIETNLQLKIEPSLKAAEWFNGQLATFRKNLIDAEKKLSAYQREKGIVFLEQRWDVENSKLEQLSQQLVEAQADAFDSTSRSKEASSAKSIDENPDILQNPLIQNMKGELNKAEANLAEIKQRLNTNHPTYQAALAEVSNLRTKLNAEVKKVTQSLSNSANLSDTRVSDLETALEKQKTRILDLNQLRDEIAVLELDVESAQQTLDIALQRFSQTSMESETNQSDVAVLTRAVSPINHSSPNVKRNIFLAFILGFILAVASALLLELISPRVRSPEDISLPVLGVLRAHTYQ